MIAVLIGYEAISRLFAPVPIRFAEAIPIAILGLVVNVASAWLLATGGHHHHGHDHPHTHSHGGREEERQIDDLQGALVLSIFENNHPPVFRIYSQTGRLPAADTSLIETERADGTRQTFRMTNRGSFLESEVEIPEPHAFKAAVRLAGREHRVVFEEHEHGHDAHAAAHRDNNMRAAVIHVMADAAVSVLVIVGLLLARAFGWLWMDPLAGTVGACVIASWSYGLIRDTGAILLDMDPDPRVAREMRCVIEADGDRLTDLHLWRLGPGHLGAIVSVVTGSRRDARFYRERLAGFRSLSHLTIEIDRLPNVG